ncbi:MAG: LptF/LptG family permease [Chromatiales bacterium]|nr:LptF/LptG family permease [Chromatiales bacterium]
MANGDRFAVLLKGRRYEGTPGSAEYRVMEFERYAVRIETREARAVEESPKTACLTDLLRNPSDANKAELLWRLAIPLQALNLVLIAVPLVLRQSARRPRQQSAAGDAHLPHLRQPDQRLPGLGRPGQAGIRRSVCGRRTC